MKKYIAEFTGTLFLVFIACGVAATTGCLFPGSGYVATALSFGLALIAAAYSIGNVSGCHINPAVSVGMAVAGRMKWLECLKYVVAQTLGAIAGAALLGLCLGNFKSLGANGFGGTLLNGTIVNCGIAMLVEIILTFIFVLTILGVTSKKENSQIAGFIIGLSLIGVHLIGIPFTGTSVNPARSLGPALLQGGKALSQVWLFILAPIVGCVLAGLFYKFILEKKDK